MQLKRICRRKQSKEENNIFFKFFIFHAVLKVKTDGEQNGLLGSLIYCYIVSLFENDRQRSGE